MVIFTSGEKKKKLGSPEVGTVPGPTTRYISQYKSIKQHSLFWRS